MALQVNCDYATEKMPLINYLDRITDQWVQIWHSASVSTCRRNWAF